LAALASLLEKGRYDSASTVSSSSTSDEAQTSGRSDDIESPKIRRLSPDSTAGWVDLSLVSDSRQCQVKTEQADVYEAASTSVTKQLIPDDCHVTSKCDAQALVGTVYHQLREVEQRRKMVFSFQPVLPASMTGTVVTDVVPDCQLVVDQSLLELASEARQIPAVGSEREVLVQQVIQSVVDAHLKTCNYTREEVSAGFQRHCQVCHSQLHSL